MMQMQPSTHVLHEQFRMSFGMKLMGIMMGFCLGGAVVTALEPVIGVPAAILFALTGGILFAGVSLSYHRLMGPLMALCCGAAVLLAAAPGIGIAAAAGLAIAFGGTVGFVSQRFMAGVHDG